MSRREDIDNAVWSDPEFHDLSPNAKLVYLWSFTNPRCGMAGIYKVVLGAVALETGIERPAVDDALRELQDARFVFFAGGVLWVRSRVKHLRTKTPQIARSIATDLERLGDCELRRRFITEYRSLGWLSDPLQTLTRASAEVHEKVSEQAESGDPRQRVTRGSGDPLGYGQGKGSSEKPLAQAREADGLPDDLPGHLHSPAQRVHEVLTRLASLKPQATAPTLAAVGRTLAAYPDRDHVDVANDVEHYWAHGPGSSKSVKDVVATYRNRLKTAPIVAGARNGAAPVNAFDRRAARIAELQAEGRL